ncbi:hypothetical protein XENOCAPTIV_015426 [Xenoophorus captivus]|uniref:Uncharacterized protein n=1 Tax=Xenoophorus captivus TaxID=1517983 RepID=A0ABV0R8Y1_9TELE
MFCYQLEDTKCSSHVILFLSVVRKVTKNRTNVKQRTSEIKRINLASKSSTGQSSIATSPRVEPGWRVAESPQDSIHNTTSQGTSQSQVHTFQLILTIEQCSQIQLFIHIG